MIVDVRPGSTPSFSSPRLLFQRPTSGIPFPWGFEEGFDVTADGELFLAFQQVDAEGLEASTPGGSLVVVQNWFAEFEERSLAR